MPPAPPSPEAIRLAGLIDHTLLRPDASEAEIRRLCEEALEHRFAAVCTHSCWTPLAAELLAGSGVAVCAVVAFPSGASHLRLKVQEAAGAVALGAAEIDAVLNLALIKGGDVEGLGVEIALLREATQGSVLKLILETAALTEAETRLAARVAVEGGADFLKTSTGFGPGGATEADVRLLREVAAERARVKASGGIRDLAAAKRMLAAGADRIGASGSVGLMREAMHAQG
jgi:deoxyribose-phosphate aldolase